ncbi:MAG: hypothetical protein V3W44_08710 [Dehalococcoidales bacterium]
MPKTEPSPGAMRAAKEIGAYLVGWKNYNPAIFRSNAAIIDKHTKQTWTLCSEQMPTKEDANAQGNVLYGYPTEGYLMTAPWNLWSMAEELENDFDHTYTHWTHHPNNPEREDG